MGLKFNSGGSPANPGAGKVELYTDTSDKRLKSIDETPTTRVYADRDSAEAFTNKTITLAAGTLSVAPLTLTSGTNLTTPSAGALEYDGTVGYFTPFASSRHVNDSEQLITLTSTYTLANQAAAQHIFNVPTNGALTVSANTSYFFECMFSLSSMSSSSGSFGFALGGTASIAAQLWWATANKATLATQIAWTSTLNTAANTALTASNTNTVAAAFIVGKIRVTTTGTVVPSVSQGNAAAAVVAVDSYFRIWPVGANTVQSVGNWS